MRKSEKGIDKERAVHRKKERLIERDRKTDRQTDRQRMV